MSADRCEEGDLADDLTSFVVVSTAPESFQLTESMQQVETEQDMTKLKHRLMTAWNNVKYGGWSMKSKPHLSKSSPVCLLGHSYLLSSEDEREKFRRMFSSLVWLTYRKGFSPLGGSSFTSDCGWGCMLRTAQMLLARGLFVHEMREGWTCTDVPHRTTDDTEVGSAQSERAGDPGRPCRRRSESGMLDGAEDTEESRHRRLVAKFGDTPSAPFGLHKLVELGMALGKRAGDWYGPSIAAHILRKAVAVSGDSSLAVYVAQDCTVYIEDVQRLCDCNKSVIILVPVRLGADTLNPAYVECVKKLLQLKSSIGVIGGKPKHSLYFVGFQDDKLLYLDPHLVQAAVDVLQDSFPLESFHCKTLRKMSFHHMDPSCALGFYTRNRRDFDKLHTDITKALTSSRERYPIFSFVEGSGREENGAGVLTADPVVHITPKVKSKRTSKASSTDEFVLL